MPADEDFNFTIDLQDGRFELDFAQNGVPSLVIDEPEPVGERSGPNGAGVLSAAVGNCLSASGLCCLRRARIDDVRGMHRTVSRSLERSQPVRLRIAGIRVRIEPVVDESEQPPTRRRLEFEDFCVVTRSVGQGIEVNVAVEPTSDRRAAGDL